MQRKIYSELLFQERSIKTWLEQLDSIFHDIQEFDTTQPSGDADFSSKEILNEKRNRFELLSKRLYNTCIAYFETKNLPLFISKFDEAIKPLFKNTLSLFSTRESQTESRSALTETFKDFLFTFREFGGVDDDIIKLAGLTYLENILQNTAVIIRERELVVNREEDVYKAVKILCQAAFPNAQYPSESFQKTAKCYVPDILIPSLGCAIEYKYAKVEQRLINTIDEIHADVKGYADNTTYSIFYAVFYVSPGIWNKDRFDIVWSEKKFPDNWKGIFVLGG